MDGFCQFLGLCPFDDFPEYIGLEGICDLCSFWVLLKDGQIPSPEEFFGV